MKFWIQSFLLGVPKIIVGFRTPEGILKRIEEIDTASIPGTVKRRGKGTWDGNMCINFASALLDCESALKGLGFELTESSFKIYDNWRWCLEDSKERTVIGY
jgi:RAT1-interacting protein